MLNVHMDDGQTLKFDLADPDQLGRWEERFSNRAFQSRIRGLTINHMGVRYSLPRPDEGELFMSAERVTPDPERKIKGGERIVCQMGDVRITIMVHAEQRAARVSVARTGHQRYNPAMRG